MQSVSKPFTVGSIRLGSIRAMEIVVWKKLHTLYSIFGKFWRIFLIFDELTHLICFNFCHFSFPFDIRLLILIEWPPNSPDVNPLNYAVWSILEEKAYQKPHPNVESLKKALKKAWKEITLETLEKIVDNFPKRLKACVDANGGYFE